MREAPGSCKDCHPFKRNIGFFVYSLIISLTVFSGGNAYAHKVNMFAYAEGNNIYVEGYFADGKKAKRSEVIVYDSSGMILLKGETDKMGRFSFKIPKKTDLRITLNAGLGHKTEYTLTASELSDINRENAPDLMEEESSKKNIPDAEPKASRLIGRVEQSIDRKEIQILIENAVAKAIKPLLRSLAEMKERASFTEIIGGIGYIFGIFGIVFYLKARKKI